LYPLAITIRSRLNLKNCAEASWPPLASCVIVHGRVPAGTSRPGTAQPAALPTLQEQQQQDIVFLETGALELQTLGSHAQTIHYQQQRCSDAGLQQLSASGSGALICSDSSPVCSTSTVQPGQHNSLHSLAEVRVDHTQYQASLQVVHLALQYRVLGCSGSGQ
jgi:hypothetical protein